MSETAESAPIYCTAGVKILRVDDLVAAGWERRTVTDPAKAAELEALYASLGFETMTTGLDPSSFGEECTTCAVTACATYVAVFTRERRSR